MQNDFEIDRYRLDDELVGQPQLAYTSAVAEAEARAKLDDAEAALRQAKAEVANDLRARPETYGVAKVTEGVVDAIVEADPGVVALAKRWRAARLALGLAQAASTAAEHKKRALEKLVDLHGRDYFGTMPPKTAEGGTGGGSVAPSPIRGRAKKETV
jgi:hypothetical protein